jgi:Methyltransferase domain
MSRPKITDEEIRLVGPILRKMVWSDRKTREAIQKYGANIIPTDFYSNTPSISEIESSYEYATGEAPYRSEALFDHAFLTQTLAELSRHSLEFDPAVEGNEETAETFFWSNSQFSYSDAMSYYCFIRKLKPKRIVEIGSGFSTLVAVEALQKNESGSIVCVEPFPRPFLQRNPNISLVQKRAQQIDPDFLNDSLQDGDILFIDSTHTVKTGSDCLHIYLRLLPYIKRNIYVHVHDVYLPFGLPMEWLLEKQVFWTEQYLLLALLTDNPKAKVIYGSAYHHSFNRQALDQMMHGRCLSGGGSFWFEYKGNHIFE